MTDQISQDLIATLRSKLEERSRQLHEEMLQEKVMPERAESDSQDIETSYVSDLDQQIGEGLVQQHAVELNEIDAALQRIEAGVYGICQDCEAEIGSRRLAAYPTARRCIECKEVFEKQSGLP